MTLFVVFLANFSFDAITLDVSTGATLFPSFDDTKLNETIGVDKAPPRHSALESI